MIIRVVYPCFIEGDISGNDNLFLCEYLDAEDIRRVITNQVSDLCPWLNLLLLGNVMDKEIGFTAVHLEMGNAWFALKRFDG